MTPAALALLGATALAGAHAPTPLFERASARNRLVLANVSGGAGLAYVCLYLLFQLANKGAAKIHAWLPLGPAPLETLFLLLLAALSISYALQATLQGLSDLRHDYYGQLAFFVVYNLLAGTGLLEEARSGALGLDFYVVALGLHMLFNERFLAHLCPAAHTWRSRLALALAPLLGCGCAIAFRLPAGVLYALLTAIASGTLINVVHRELPKPEQFRPVAFLVGVVVYAALIIGTWHF